MLQQFQSMIAFLGPAPQALGILGVGLGTMLVLFGLAATLRGQNPVLRRIAEQSVRGRPSAFDAGLLRPADQAPTGLMKGLIPTDMKERSQIRRQLAEAGLTGPHSVRNFYLVRLLLGLALPLGLLGLVMAARAGTLPLPQGLTDKLMGLSPLMLVEILTMLVAAGFFGPTRWLQARVAARRTAIRRAFPNVLDLLQISVEAGLGFDAAMIRVANETARSAPEISREFLTAQREIQAGRSREKALVDMANRTGVAEVNSFAGVILQSIQFGASISDALTTYAEEMRQARELQAQEMANKLPVKMSGVMATLMLPALLTLALGPVVIRYIRFMAG